MSRLRKLSEENSGFIAPAPTMSPREFVDSVNDPASNILDYFGNTDDDLFRGSDSSGIPFLRLSSAERFQLRLLGPYKEGRGPFIKFAQHAYQTGGSWVFSLDLDYASRSEELRNILAADGKLNEEDIEKISRCGDPFNVLARALTKFIDKEAPKRLRLWPRFSFAWNVVNREDNCVYVLETGSSFKDEVKTFLEAGSGLLSPGGMDLFVRSNERTGTDRRYKYATMPRSNADTEDYTPVDLDEVVLMKFSSLSAKVGHLFQKYGSQAREVGLSPADWMVQEGAESPANLEDDFGVEW